MHDEPYRLIPLRRRDGSIRAEAIVDAGDHHSLVQWRWSLLSTGYAQRGTTINGKRVVILMHRQLLGLELGDRREADHRNGNRLDNRRANLRIVLRQGNAQNRTVARGTSAYVGVSYRAEYGTWHASAKVDGVIVNLGDWANELDAAATAAQFRHARMPWAIEDRDLLAYRVPPKSRRLRVLRIERAEEIQRRWLAGESMQQIADALGFTRNALGSTMTMLRKAGYDLPYRRVGWT